MRKEEKIMRFKYRLAFNSSKNRKVLDYLENTRSNFKKEEQISVVYIFEDEPDFQKIMNMFDTDPLVDLSTIYSKEEMNSAEWFSVRSTYRWEYPKPDGDKNNYKYITYNLSDVCQELYCGIKQVDLFQIKKEPDWKNRNFLMLNWIHGELFIKKETGDFLISEGLKGFKLNDVKIYKKDMVAEDIKQIYVESSLKQGLIVDDGIKEVVICKLCGEKKYVGSGKPRHFKREIFENLDVDIIKSHEVFGIGSVNDRRIFVSKHFYDILITNKLDRNLDFEPVIFFD